MQGGTYRKSGALYSQFQFSIQFIQQGVMK
jgi:hypothetical protein